MAGARVTFLDFVLMQEAGVPPVGFWQHDEQSPATVSRQLLTAT
jgi:hypothetical protein